MLYISYRLTSMSTAVHRKEVSALKQQNSGRESVEPEAKCEEKPRRRSNSQKSIDPARQQTHRASKNHTEAIYIYVRCGVWYI